MQKKYIFFGVQSSRAKIRRWLLLVGCFLPLGIAYVVLASRKIELVTADLGRHLANGHFLFSHPELLQTNFYSFTFPAFPFVNHHWGSGLVFYRICAVFGFSGLALTYLALNLGALFLMFCESWRRSSLAIAWAATLYGIPLVAYRTEIRPEAFSFFFCALFFFLLSRWRDKGTQGWLLLALPLCMLLWVNLHVYFIFGLVVLGAFLVPLWVEHWRGKSSRPPAIRNLLLIALLSVAAALVNPIGYRLVLAPFRIFENYGYSLIENQSFYFLWRYGIFHSAYLNLLALFTLALLAVPAYRSLARLPSFHSLVALVLLFGAMAILAVRNLPLFGLFSGPLLASIFQQLLQEARHRRRTKVLFASFALMPLLLCGLGLAYSIDRFGFGLDSAIEHSARFFREQKMRGPIFNNYDIGGYLTYELFPVERVFVDNRPEAYPATFFRDTYIPMQEDESKWREAERTYGFNVIYFYWHDLTSWGQRFILQRTQDPNWVPVFVDNYALILVRNAEANKSLIERFQIPRENFRTAKQ